MIGSDAPGGGEGNGTGTGEPRPSGAAGEGMPEEGRGAVHPSGGELLEHSHRLVGKISAESRRVRISFFAGTCLFMVTGAILVLVAVFYLKYTFKRIEERMDRDTTAITARFEERLHKLLDETKARNRELEEAVAVVKNAVPQVAALAEEKGALARSLDRAEKETADAKHDLRRAMEDMARERAELAARKKLLDDLLALLQPAGETSPKGEGRSPGEGPVSILRLVNRVLEECAEGHAIRILECEWLGAGVFRKPLIRMDDFMDQGPAVLSPELAVFLFDEEGNMGLHAYGGAFLPLGGRRTPLPGRGVRLLDIPIENQDKELFRFMKRLLGLEGDWGGARVRGRSSRGGAGPATPGDTPLEILNRLLEGERGGRYRFTRIGSVEEEGTLRDVEFEERDAAGAMEHAVRAGRCEIVLDPGAGNLEIRFHDGFFRTGKDERPFYNGLFKVSITGIKKELWIESAGGLIRTE